MGLIGPAENGVATIADPGPDADHRPPGRFVRLLLAGLTGRTRLCAWFDIDISISFASARARTLEGRDEGQQVGRGCRISRGSRGGSKRGPCSGPAGGRST